MRETLQERRFKVNPKALDKNLFIQKRADKQQESTRIMIMEALTELERNPEEYGCAFETMIPIKTWSLKSVEDLKILASQLGDHTANYVEWGLELAQRISNGEPWESICNIPDIAEWYRLVIWKNGQARIVGGACMLGSGNPESNVSRDYFRINHKCRHIVPLVVCYE